MKLGNPRVQRVICVSLHPIFAASSLWEIPSRRRIASILSMIAPDQSISRLTAGSTFSNCLWNNAFCFISSILYLRYWSVPFPRQQRFPLRYPLAATCQISASQEHILDISISEDEYLIRNPQAEQTNPPGFKRQCI